MKCALARPAEVPGVGFLDLGIPSLGEAELMFRSVPRARVACDRGHEIQGVCVEPKDTQQSSETREIAIDDLLKVGNASRVPVLQLVECEDINCNEDVNRGHDFGRSKNFGNRALDSPVERIPSIRREHGRGARRRCLLGELRPVG